MRVLVANIPLPQNRFLVDLNAALTQSVDVTHSHEAFWAMEKVYGLLHQHCAERLEVCRT